MSVLEGHILCAEGEHIRYQMSDTDWTISLTQAQFLRSFSVELLGGEMQRLPLVHLTVDDTSVRNLLVI